MQVQVYAVRSAQTLVPRGSTNQARTSTRVTFRAYQRASPYLDRALAVVAQPRIWRLGDCPAMKVAQ